MIAKDTSFYEGKDQVLESDSGRIQTMKEIQVECT